MLETCASRESAGRVIIPYVAGKRKGAIHAGSDSILWVDAHDNLPRPRTRRSGTPSLARQTTPSRREGEIVLVIFQPLRVAIAFTIVSSPSHA